MAIHKLDLGEFDEIDYHLIAIHTSLEDYRLAYFINQLLPINLCKNGNEIQILLNTINSVSTAYSVYSTKIKAKNNLIF